MHELRQGATVQGTTCSPGAAFTVHQLTVPYLGRRLGAVVSIVNTLRRLVPEHPGVRHALTGAVSHTCCFKSPNGRRSFPVTGTRCELLACTAMCRAVPALATSCHLLRYESGKCHAGGPLPYELIIAQRASRSLLPYEKAPDSSSVVPHPAPPLSSKHLQ